MDFESVERAMQGAYGAWINTDGFTVGEEKEVFAGMRIFEVAKHVGTMRHYIYSNLDYSLKVSWNHSFQGIDAHFNVVLQKGGYNPDYNVGHYDGKGRVAEWMKAQPSNTTKDGMTWSAVTTGPYMDMLNIVSPISFTIYKRI